MDTVIPNSNQLLRKNADPSLRFGRFPSTSRRKERLLHRSPPIPNHKGTGVWADTGEAQRVSGKIGATSLHLVPPPIQTSPRAGSNGNIPVNANSMTMSKPLLACEHPEPK